MPQEGVLFPGRSRWRYTESGTGRGWPVGQTIEECPFVKVTVLGKGCLLAQLWWVQVQRPAGRRDVCTSQVFCPAWSVGTRRHLAHHFGGGGSKPLIDKQGGPPSLSLAVWSRLGLHSSWWPMAGPRTYCSLA